MDITLAIFTLIGALIGAVVTFLGTFMTLKHQQRVWLQQTQVEELRNELIEIDDFINDLAEVNFSNDASGKSSPNWNSPKSCAALYKLWTGTLISDTSVISSQNSVEDFSKLILELRMRKKAIKDKLDAIYQY